MSTDGSTTPGAPYQDWLAIARVHRETPSVQLGLNCLLGAHITESLDRMVDLAADWGVSCLKLLPIHINLQHSWKGDIPPNLLLTPDHADALADQLDAAWHRARALGLYTSSRAFLQATPAYLRGELTFPCYAGYAYGNVDPYGNIFPCYDHRVPLNIRDRGLIGAWRSDAMQQMRGRVRTCSNPCWNSGNAEPSLRMDLARVLRDPRQIVADLEFLLA